MRRTSSTVLKIYILVLVIMEIIYLTGCEVDAESPNPGSLEGDFYMCMDDDTYYLLQNLPRTAMLGDKPYNFVAGNFMDNTAALLMGPEDNSDLWQSATVERNSQMEIEGYIITVIEIGQQSDDENYMSICIEKATE